MELPNKRFILYLVLLAIVIAWLVSGLIFAQITEPFVSLNECFVTAPSIHYYPEIYTLGIRTEMIIFCESGGNPNAYNESSGASGLLQVIPSSERFCEKGLGRELDMFDPEDNMMCGAYLKEHGGLAHWAASAHCWK